MRQYSDFDTTLTTAAKIQKAADLYRATMGFPPEICLLHPLTPDMPGRVGAIEVYPCRAVIPNHFMFAQRTERTPRYAAIN